MISRGGITDNGEVVDLEVPDRACLYGAGNAAGGRGGTRRRCFFGRLLLRVGG